MEAQALHATQTHGALALQHAAVIPLWLCKPILVVFILLQVYKGRRRCTGQITAMKFIMKHGKSEKDIKNLRQEIEILRQLRHENVIQMLDAFETKTDFCVVTGTIGQDVHGVLYTAAARYHCVQYHSSSSTASTIAIQGSGLSSMACLHNIMPTM